MTFWLLPATWGIGYAGYAVFTKPDFYMPFDCRRCLWSVRAATQQPAQGQAAAAGRAAFRVRAGDTLPGLRARQARVQTLSRVVLFVADGD